MSTIKDVAEKAGVSIATVSYVLNNSVKISEETRQKVLKAARELNYSPNKIAKSLKTKKTHTIGVITEDITVFSTPDIIDGINRFTEEYSYHVILNNLRLYKRLGNDYSKIGKYIDEINEVVRVLISRQIEGIIYVGAHPRDVSGIIDNFNIPIVYTYCYSSNKEDYSVNYNDELAAYEATEHLIQMGHEKIGVITGLIDSLSCQRRLKGYQNALMNYDLNFDPRYVKVGNWEYDSGYTQGKELLSMTDRPTAIFAMNDLMAGGVIDAATELGIDIPRDLSLVGFDNKECSFFYIPKLTTMALPLSEMGKKSAEILINLINNKKVKDNRIELKCNLIERNSVAVRLVK